MKYYTLYNKDDEYLFGGTAKECADFLEIKYDTFMKQKVRCKIRNSKIIIFEIEDESIEYVPNLWLLKCVENCSIKMNETFYFKRNELINEIYKIKGISVKQMCRILGLDKNVIYRAIKEKLI